MQTRFSLFPYGRHQDELTQALVNALFSLSFNATNAPYQLTSLTLSHSLSLACAISQQIRYECVCIPGRAKSSFTNKTATKDHEIQQLATSARDGTRMQMSSSPHSNEPLSAVCGAYSKVVARPRQCHLRFRFSHLSRQERNCLQQIQRVALSSCSDSSVGSLAAPKVLKRHNTRALIHLRLFPSTCALRLPSCKVAAS